MTGSGASAPKRSLVAMSPTSSMMPLVRVQCLASGLTPEAMERLLACEPLRALIKGDEPPRVRIIVTCIRLSSVFLRSSVRERLLFYSALGTMVFAAPVTMAFLVDAFGGEAVVRIDRVVGRRRWHRAAPCRCSTCALRHSRSADVGADDAAVDVIMDRGCRPKGVIDRLDQRRLRRSPSAASRALKGRIQSVVGGEGDLPDELPGEVFAAGELTEHDRRGG